MHFSCVRILHFLSSHPIPEIHIPSKAWQFYSPQKLNTKGISFFYNIIQDKRTFRESNAMNKWESQITTFTDDQWKTAFREIHKASHCVGHWKMMLRISNRCQYTPYRLKKVLSPYFISMLAELRPYRKSPTYLLGMPELNKFLETNISSLTRVITPPNPELAKLYIERFPHNLRQVVSHGLLAVQTFVLHNWKAVQSVNVPDVIKLVHQNYTLEWLLTINSLSCKSEIGIGKFGPTNITVHSSYDDHKKVDIVYYCYDYLLTV